MASFRYIDPAIRRSKSISKLTYRQRDLWIGLILTADDQGRRESDEALVRSDVFPYEDLKLSEIEMDLKELVKAGFILLYKSGDKRLLQIINWHKYQKQAEWLGLSAFPAPPGWQDRYRYHGKGNTVITSDNWATYKQGSYLPTQLPTPLPANDGDVNGNRDVNGDGNSDGEPARSDSPSEMQLVLEKITGIPPSNAGDIQAMHEIEAFHPLQVDIQAGFDWVTSQGKRIYHYSSLVNPIKVAIAKRVQKPKSNQDQSLEAIRQFVEESNER